MTGDEYQSMNLIASLVLLLARLDEHEYSIGNLLLRGHSGCGKTAVLLFLA